MPETALPPAEGELRITPSKRARAPQEFTCAQRWITEARPLKYYFAIALHPLGPWRVLQDWSYAEAVTVLLPPGRVFVRRGSAE